MGDMLMMRLSSSGHKTIALEQQCMFACSAIKLRKMVQKELQIVDRVPTRVCNFPDFSFPGKRETGKGTKIPGIPGKFPGNPVNFLFPGKFPEKSGNSREIPGTNPTPHLYLE